MVHTKTTSLFLLVTAIFLLVDARPDYYWRDYDGTIPEDAFVGGQNATGKNVYVGQTYISREGLVPVQIHPGVRHVFAEIKGVKHSDKHIKILCGSPQNFEWVQANSSTLHIDLINKHPVKGGHEDGWGIYLVGRINFENSTCIGKVLESGIDGRSLFYCVDKRLDYQAADQYQVLVSTNGKDKY